MVVVGDFECAPRLIGRPLFAASCDRRKLMACSSGAVAAIVLPAGFARAQEVGFARAQLETVGKLCDALIPRTDTPGAVDAGCIAAAANRGSAMPAAKRQDFRAGLDDIGVLFAKSPDASWRQVAGAVKGKQAAAVLETLRAWILFDYYTSEQGATQELRYEPVPGRYDPDVRVTADTRAYSSDWIGVSMGGAR